MTGVHIDKVSKDMKIDISKKPVGAVQWDFVLSIPGAVDRLIEKFSKAPETVFLFITRKCNGKCKDCSMPENEEMGLEEIKRIIKELAEIGTKYVVLDGNPLLREDFWEILDELNRNNIQVSVNVDTRLDSEIIERLKKNNVKKLQFRLAGLKDVHSHYRENFSDILDSLKTCSKHGVYSSVIFSINEKNISDVERLVEFCRDNGIGQFSFIRLPCCPFLPLTDPLRSNEFFELSKKLVEIRRTEKEVHITSNDPIWKGCGACLTSCTILHDGSVVPCSYFRIGQFNISEGMKGIWLSEIFDNLRRGIGLKGRCGKCEYKVMYKGCRAIALSETNDYLSEDSGCWL
jgi:radical SAM protein with 4Fe4S-binding SPASM domain